MCAWRAPSARLRVVICVSLSTAAIVLPPSGPSLFHERLRARVGMVREQACQRALTRKQVEISGEGRCLRDSHLRLRTDVVAGST